MARPKQIKNPKKIPVTIEKEQYEQLLANGIFNFSEWVRNRIDDYITVENDLDKLKQVLNEKEKEKENLALEIETIRQKILELETQQKENEENKTLQLQMLETIQNVIMNEFNGDGITKERLITINQARLTSTKLKELIKDNNINIIKPAELKTSKILINGEKTKKQQHNTPVIEVNNLDKLALQFKKELNRQNMNNRFSDISAKEFLGENLNKYRSRCDKQNISFADFQRAVLNI